MVLLEALAAVGALALAYVTALAVCFVKIAPWSPRDRDHSLEVAKLPYPLYAFGCWSRAVGSFLLSLIPAPMAAVELATRFLQSQVLFAVVQLGVPDALLRHNGPATSSQLAAECCCPNVEWLDRVLRAAAVLGILTARKSRARRGTGAKQAAAGAPARPAVHVSAAAATPDGGAIAAAPAVDMFSAADELEYALNSVSACLCKSHKSSVQAMIKLYAYNYDSAAALTKSLRSGQVSHELQAGQGFWPQLASDAVKGAVFDEAMTSFKDLGGASVVSCKIWRELDAVVDIAGGNGSFIASLLMAHPKLTGAVVDQPDQVSRGEAWWRETYPDLQPRMRFSAGDMFDPTDIPAPPSGRAAYVLRNILHNWPDPQALQLLKCIRAAIPAAGPPAKLLIIEMTSSTGGMPPLLEPRLLADIQMLTLFGNGKERNQQQFAALLTAAGFRLSRVLPTTGLLLLLEAEPV